MALSAFDDKSSPPSDDALREVLGKAHDAWQALFEELTATLGLRPEWGYTSTSSGWSLRIKRETRVIFYLTPSRGAFLASTALGEKAVRAAHELPLPDRFLAVVDAAPKYAEGRGVRLEIRNRRDVKPLIALAGIKLAH
jgi:hypothetical protein